MKAKNHNRFLGTLFLIFMGLNILPMIVLFAIISATPERPPDQELSDGEALGNLGMFIGFIFSAALALLASPLLIIALGIFSRWRWARIGGIVGGGLALLISFFGNGSGAYLIPLTGIFSFDAGLAIGGVFGLLNLLFGIGLLGYAIWFLSGEQGRQFYSADTEHCVVNNCKAMQNSNLFAKTGLRN